MVLWMQAAKTLSPKGSKQYVTRNNLRTLRNLDYLRGILKLPKNDSVEVKLESTNGKSHKVLIIPTAKRSPRYGRWPIGSSRLLEGKVGYLRLTKMNKDAVEDINRWMPKFKDTKGIQKY